MTPTPFSLGGELTFATALERLAELEPRLADGDGPLDVDLSQVAYADSAGMSLLLELERRARARGRELRLRGAPEQMKKLAQFFGIADLLKLGA